MLFNKTKNLNLFIIKKLRILAQIFLLVLHEGL